MKIFHNFKILALVQFRKKNQIFKNYLFYNLHQRKKNIFSTAPPSIDRQPRARHVPPRLKPVRVVSKDRKPKKSKESENKINKTAKGWYQLAPI